MFSPKYTISNTLLSNIKRITGIIAEINSRSFTEVVKMEIARQAREISVFASTSIEGNPLPLTDVKRILKTKPAHIRDSEREVLNYNKALLELDKLIRKGSIAFNIKFIEQIQKTVVEGLIPKSSQGRIRKEPVFVNDPRTGKTVFLPPEQKELKPLLRELFDFVNKSKDRIDPLILAGIFHKQLVLIHPFMDGNGRTARLATKALLAGMGLDTFNLFSFENYYNRNVSKYFAQVGESGDYYEIKDRVDFTSWLEYFTDGIIDELLRVKKELEKEMKTPKTALKEQHRAIIAHIKKHGFITDEDYSSLTDRARSTRHLDFQKLIALGIIEKVGDKKGAYYRFKGTAPVSG
jgi:Fic family protein